MKIIIDKLLLFAQDMFFNKVGTKFSPRLLKNFFDPIFIIFEKIGYKFDFISSNYIKLYEEIVEGELSLVKASSKDSILVVGCGSLPGTAALIAQKTKGKVLAIDKDPKAINAANNFVKKLDIKNLKIEHADGQNYKIKNFDIIFLLYGLRKEKKILDNFAQNMKDNAKILFRLPIDIKKEEKQELLKKFEIKGCKRSETLGAVDSYLLVKKKI